MYSLRFILLLSVGFAAANPIVSSSLSSIDATALTARDFSFQGEFDCTCTANGITETCAAGTCYKTANGQFSESPGSTCNCSGTTKREVSVREETSFRGAFDCTCTNNGITETCAAGTCFKTADGHFSSAPGSTCDCSSNAPAKKRAILPRQGEFDCTCSAPGITETCSGGRCFKTADGQFSESAGTTCNCGNDDFDNIVGPGASSTSGDS